MALSDILKKLRSERNITQEDLAKATKLSRSAIGMYESGSRRPDYETLEVLADYYNVNMDALLGREPAIPTMVLSPSEKNIIMKYRQLDADGREDVDDYVDMKLAKLQRKAEEEGLKLG